MVEQECADVMHFCGFVELKMFSSFLTYSRNTATPTPPLPARSYKSVTAPKDPFFQNVDNNKYAETTLPQMQLCQRQNLPPLLRCLDRVELDGGVQQ